MATRLDEMRQSRVNKLEQLQKQGIDPYPPTAKRTHTVNQATKKDDLKVTVVGRLVSWRGHGKLQFADLKDESGNIQLAFRVDNLSKDQFSLLKLLDVGDFIQVTGTTFTTKTGERTIEVKDLTLLTKAINPLPNKWFGLKDIEERYRKRYLDLILNDEVKSRLEVGSHVIRSIREFLNRQDFIEIETPTLQPVYGGGFAKPFVTHHNALDSNFYLRISDEMYLKRLIVGGFEKVYEITKVFRNEGIDHDHNPEFTMFEAQIAYEDYHYGMDLIEEIIQYAAKMSVGSTRITYQDVELNFNRPWQRLRLVEAVKKYTGVDPMDWQTLDQAKKATLKIKQIDKSKHQELDKIETIGEIIAFAFEEAVEKQLIQPTIIYDYPIEVSPLAKKCKDPRFTQRFEMFAYGMELGNNYTELNDPIDLRQRFIEEKRREKAGFEEAHQTDEDYLNAIEHGFPPTCGLAIGIDRLVMLLTNAPNIKEVIAFPLLKPLLSERIARTQKPSKSVSTKFTIDPQVTEKFPGMFYAYTIISNVKVRKSNQKLDQLKERVLKKYTPNLKDISTMESVKPYRDIFKQTGVWGMGRRPSPEALYRRLAQGKGIYNVNTAVDAYNLAVIETGISLGGFDNAHISSPVTLRFTQKGESMQLLGDKKLTQTKPGEMAYADIDKPFTLDLNYRDIDATKITNKTTEILLFADGAPGIKLQQVVDALQKGAEYITRYCDGTVGELVVVDDQGSSLKASGGTRYKYKANKIVAIINPKLSKGQAVNALGHMAFSAGHYSDESWMGQKIIQDADGQAHTGIAKYPLVVLQASTSQLKELITKARKNQSISIVDYPQEMFDTGKDDELVKAISKTKGKDIEYHAVLLKGSSTAIDSLTKSLKLYK